MGLPSSWRWASIGGGIVASLLSSGAPRGPRDLLADHVTHPELRESETKPREADEETSWARGRSCMPQGTIDDGKASGRGDSTICRLCRTSSATRVRLERVDDDTRDRATNLFGAVSSQLGAAVEQDRSRCLRWLELRGSVARGSHAVVAVEHRLLAVVAPVLGVSE